MKTYETQIMIQKEGREPARLGYFEVEATSEQAALEIATAAGNKKYNEVCEALGHTRDESIRIWAELYKEEETA